MQRQADTDNDADIYHYYFSAPKTASPGKTLQKNPSVEKVKLRKPAGKKAAPIVPPPLVATPEKDEADVKVVEEEFKGLCSRVLTDSH